MKSPQCIVTVTLYSYLDIVKLHCHYKLKVSHSSYIDTKQLQWHCAVTDTLYISSETTTRYAAVYFSSISLMTHPDGATCLRSCIAAHAGQQQTVQQSPHPLPSMPSLSRTLPLFIIKGMMGHTNPQMRLNSPEPGSMCSDWSYRSHGLQYRE